MRLDFTATATFIVLFQSYEGALGAKSAAAVAGSQSSFVNLIDLPDFRYDSYAISIIIRF